jgi:hypothetical protein
MLFITWLSYQRTHEHTSPIKFRAASNSSICLCLASKSLHLQSQNSYTENGSASVNYSLAAGYMTILLNPADVRSKDTVFNTEAHSQC